MTFHSKAISIPSALAVLAITLQSARCVAMVDSLYLLCSLPFAFFSSLPSSLSPSLYRLQYSAHLISNAC